MKLQGTRTDNGQVVTFDLHDIWYMDKNDDIVEITAEIGIHTIVLSSIVPVPALDPAVRDFLAMCAAGEKGNKLSTYYWGLNVKKRAAELLAEMEQPANV